jgi:hypothetical protein
MKQAVLVVVLVLVCCPIRSFTQGAPIALTDKITSLDGVWIYDPAKSVRGSCANTVTDQSDRIIRIRISPQGVNFESGRPMALLPLDGSPTTLMGSGVATAALDAGWLAVTIRRIAPLGRGTTNVFRDVYIVSDDELTIWRNFTIEWPDGSLSSTVCSYRQALVYQRQGQP